MKKALVSFATAVVLCTGGLFVMAPAANAYTDKLSMWQYNCQWDTRSLYVWRDYDWWEETFQIKHDGWVYVTSQYYPC